MKNTVIVVSGIACILAATAYAQQKVPGEKWRSTVSMQTEGFSMPARTTEVCAPVGKAAETMGQQGGDNCTISNWKQSGNKFSYDIKCTGEDGMVGHFEGENLGNTMRGSMTGKTADMTMQMKFESTKLGQACEALDYSNYKPPVVAMPTIDICADVTRNLNPGDLANVGATLLTKYPTPDGKGTADCTKHAAFKTFCSKVQTPQGFAGLDFREWEQRSFPVAANEDAAARMRRAPLNEAIRACGLGTGAAGIQALQARMLAAAEKEHDYGFLLYYGAEEKFATVQATAKRECSGRSFTNAANKDYQQLCRNFGSALARNDRPGALQGAGCNGDRTDPQRGICVGGLRADNAAATTGFPGGASSQGAAGSTQPEATPAEDAEKTATDKAKEAVEKGKKALRGLLGGG